MRRTHTGLVSSTYRRVLLPVFCLAMVMIGVFFVLEQRASRQKQAVRQIHRLGGWAFYDCRYDKDAKLIGAWPRGPRLGIRVLGVDFFGTVTGVILGPGRPAEGLPDFGLVDHNIPVRDADLAVLANLPYLEWLVLSGTSITDGGLIHLQTLARLRWLWLSNTAVSDAGLAHLAKLSSLEKIMLDGTRVRGPGLEVLARLPRLKELSLENAPLSDDGLIHLGKIEHLSHVNLLGTKCTLKGIMEAFGVAKGRSLAQILVLTNHAKTDPAGVIYAVDLSGRAVTDEELRLIESLKRVQWLYLRDNPISDRGVETLTHLPNLRLLDISRTRITAVGLTALLQHPGLEVIHAHGLRIPEEIVYRFQTRKPRPIRIYQSSDSGG